MHQKSLKISIDNVIFNCRVIGNGNKVVMAFHGFGQDGAAFLPVIKSNPDLIIYAFDLPHHGDTEIHGVLEVLSSNMIVELILELKKMIDVDRFSLLGYSIGVKFCIPIFEKFYSKIDDFWLLAPDGVGENFWYNIATGTKLSRWLFQYFMDHPTLVLSIAAMAKRFGILNPEADRLLRRSLNSPKIARTVYLAWTALRNLRWDLHQLISILNKPETRLIFIFGERDRVIKKRKSEWLVRKLKNAGLITVPGGHHTVIRKFAGGDFTGRIPRF